MLVSPHSASVTLSISLSICVCLCVLCFARANICLYCTLFDLLSLHCVRAQDSVSDSNSNSDTDSFSAHKSISIYRFRSSCLHSAQTDRGAGRQAGETQETKETGVAAFHPISLKAHLSPLLFLSLCVAARSSFRLVYLSIGRRNESSVCQSTIDFGCSLAQCPLAAGRTKLQLVARHTTSNWQMAIR